MTVDFLPPEDLKGLRTREIEERTVLAMYMNNRAVEAMVGGRIDDAYAWAREAVRQDPGFLGSVNTLGVVYLRRGALPQAVAAFGHVLQGDADHLAALSNLAGTYARQGRVEEAMHLRRRLAALEPQPPLQDFNAGLAAMKTQDYRTAREMFAREAARADGSAEFHYWLGLAHYGLGEVEQARLHLVRALQTSSDGGNRDLYSAKLDRIQARRDR
jgi:tetratricopeptide (TPR) repeat protein